MLAKNQKKYGTYSLALVLLASTLLGSSGSRASAEEASAALTSDFRSLQASQIVSEMGGRMESGQLARSFGERDPQ
ncbi:hypothetical protein ACFTAO_27385 [Paenibacillus rhizoplanae]